MVKLRQFWRDEGASLALTFAMVMPLLVPIMGAVIDHSRLVSAKQHLQKSVDSATLAAASLTQNEPAKEVIEGFIQSNLASSGIPFDELKIEVKEKRTAYFRQVDVKATASLDTSLLAMAGLPEMLISVETTALEQINHVEVALVLDISSSMNGSRIKNLRTASKQFVETLINGSQAGQMSVSVIPYGGTVKLPDSFFSLVTHDAEFSPDNIDYTIEVPSRREDWNGCLEMHADEITEIDIKAASLGVLPDFTVWNRNNDWCPPDDEATALFHSTDKEELLDLLDDFDTDILSDGTGTDVATGWGVRALDPVWRGRLGNASGDTTLPRAFDDQLNTKILIVMTDGGITNQKRPYEDWEAGVDPRHVPSGATASLTTGREARDGFQELCDYAKRNGIQVYTIAFQVNSGRNLDELAQCASSKSNFYDVKTLNISAAFEGIAARVNPLRISR